MPDMMNEDYANRAGGTASSAAVENDQPNANQIPASNTNTSALAPSVESAAPNGAVNTGVPAEFAKQQMSQMPKGNEPHNVFRSIFDALAGPSVRYTVDNNGNMIETPVKRTKTQLADSIVAGALTGLFSGLGEHGPGAEGRAAAKGFGNVLGQQQQKTNEAKQQAVGDFNRRMSTMEANLRLRQNAMQLYTLGTKAMEPYINDGKSIVGALQDQPGALLEGGRTFSASEVPDLMKKYNVTNEMLIPVGQAPVIGVNGQPETDANGVPKSQLQYMVVNPNFDISVPDDLLKKFQKYHMPGFVDSKGNPVALPKNAKAKALIVANAMHQVAAYEIMEKTLQKYNNPEETPSKSTSMPDISSSKPDPAIQGMVDKYADQSGVDKAIARALVQTESNGDPKATSPKGAKGLMQIMPFNFKTLGITDPTDPEQNIRGGMKLFKDLMDRFGSVKLALAAYNAGPDAVVKAGYRVPNIKETKDYVKKIMSLAGMKEEDEEKEQADKLAQVRKEMDNVKESE